MLVRMALPWRVAGHEQVMMGAAEDVPGLIATKGGLKYAGQEVDAIRAVAAAHSKRSLKVSACPCCTVVPSPCSRRRSCSMRSLCLEVLRAQCCEREEDDVTGKLRWLSNRYSMAVVSPRLH